MKTTALILVIILSGVAIRAQSPALSSSPPLDHVLFAMESAISGTNTIVVPATVPGAGHWKIQTVLHADKSGSHAQAVAILMLSGRPFPITERAGGPLPSFEKFKTNALKGLAAQYQATLAVGITVTSGSVTLTLAAAESDQNEFARTLTLLNTAAMPENITVEDNKGVLHSIPVATVYALLGSYEQQLATLRSNYLTGKTKVESAVTFDQL